jgi:hypothetical protein
MTTRDCYPGSPPKYCLPCASKKKKKNDTNRKPEKGMFKPSVKVFEKTGLELSQEELDKA